VDGVGWSCRHVVKIAASSMYSTCNEESNCNIIDTVQEYVFFYSEINKMPLASIKSSYDNPPGQMRPSTSPSKVIGVSCNAMQPPTERPKTSGPIFPKRLDFSRSLPVAVAWQHQSGASMKGVKVLPPNLSRSSSCMPSMFSSSSSSSLSSTLLLLATPVCTLCRRSAATERLAQRMSQ
jgi:hypothetical protein